MTSVISMAHQTKHQEEAFNAFAEKRAPNFEDD